MIQHHILLNGIPLHVQKGHIQHVEQPPVLRYCAGMGIGGQKSGNGIPLSLCIGIPDLLPADPEADHQGTGLHGLLEGPEGILGPCDLQLILIGSHKQLIPPGTDPKHLIFVILRHGIPADLQLRKIPDHRRSDEKGAGQPLKHFSQPLCLLLLLRIPQMRIGDLRLLSGHDHRLFKVVNIPKYPFQQINSRLQPAFSGQAGIGA